MGLWGACLFKLIPKNEKINSTSLDSRLTKLKDASQSYTMPNHKQLQSLEKLLEIGWEELTNFIYSPTLHLHLIPYISSRSGRIPVT